MLEWMAEMPHTWRLLDLSAIAQDGEALLPFAVEDMECREIGKGSPPLIHLWRHRKAFILGLRDRKLPQALKAMEWLGREGHAVAVRNSGGAAVPLDEGVLNISLIAPNSSGTVKLHQDFAVMAGIIKETVHRLSPGIEVAAGEIRGSYCPGAFDLAIEGRKFCGIAQRRQAGAFIVQAFIVVGGAGAERARLVADFYRQAGSGSNDTEIPAVTDHSTCSLQEMINSVSVGQFVRTLKGLLSQKKQIRQTVDGYEGYDKQRLAQLIAQMKYRYDSD